MDRNEFIDLLVSTKNINGELMSITKDIDDFPLAFQILKKIEGSDFINLLLNPKKFGQIDLAANDLNKWCINNLEEHKEESKQFIDELVEKVKLNFRFEEFEDFENTQYVLGIDLGTTNWTNGRKYVGEFRDDKKHGQGTFTWEDGGKYVGEYRDNKSHGLGTHTWANGSKYVGEYRDDKKHGKGTHTSANGDKYVGEYKYDKKHGKGTYTSANGTSWTGQWRNDSRIFY